MRNQLITILFLALAGTIAAGAYSSEKAETPPEFDYSAATPEERARFLRALSQQMSEKFKPSFLVRDSSSSYGGRSITYVYNMGMSKIDCDTEHTCEIMQCERYLNLPVSHHNISVRIKYVNSRGRQLGSQLLKKSGCTAIIDKWKKKQSF